MRGWLDPTVSLTGWRTSVENADLPDVLRALAGASDGRIVDSDGAEVLDALAHTGPDAARAFRFGHRRAFTQLWIGVVPGRAGSTKVFSLGDAYFVEDVKARLSVAGFSGEEKRADYELLRRFFIAAWGWYYTVGPGAGTRGQKGFDPEQTGASMERVLSDPGSPFLEVLRGLRRRTGDLLQDLSELDADALRALEAHLAEKGAPPLESVRLRLGS